LARERNGAKTVFIGQKDSISCMRSEHGKTLTWIMMIECNKTPRASARGVWHVQVKDGDARAQAGMK
jgi:hypothetical protein